MLLSISLRKKGGIIIKKIKFFLIFLFSIFLVNSLTLNVKAESASFYEGEYIDNIYMNKYEYSTKTIYYQKARFFRKSTTNEFAYCIEPFSFFNEKGQYESTLTPNNLTTEQIDRIKKIAHFGYGYRNHTDVKWYAITQMMIWKESDPNGGEYYFTDSLNGKKINAYENEMNEIYDMIEWYEEIPDFANKEFKLVEDEILILEDNNNHLKNYKTDESLLHITENVIESVPLKEGNYEFTVYKYEDVYNNPAIFYQANNSQNMIKTGNLDKLEFKVKVKVFKTSIEITKIDFDNESILPRGEAELNGARYAVMDENMYKFTEIEINNNIAILNNLHFGKYYIQEISTGEGYTLDENIYEIIISDETPIVNLILKNKVIEKKIIINKKYGDEKKLQNEQNINFAIYNKNNELIDIITTNEFGYAEIILPYGEYIIKQKNTTEGYEITEPFSIIVDNSEDVTIELKDMKIKIDEIVIEVPNTHTNIINRILSNLLKIFLIIIIC